MALSHSKKAETWKPVVGFEGFYEVSDRGQVRSLDRVYVNNLGRTIKLTGRILKGSYGWVYHSVSLNAGKLKKGSGVHRFVAEAFIGPIPDFYVVNHIDGNKINNHVENLEIITHSENVSKTHMTGRNPKVSILTVEGVRDIRSPRAPGVSEDEHLAMMAKKYGIAVFTVSRVLARKCWKYVT